jgi:DNA-binding response OmpR family regulator
MRRVLICEDEPLLAADLALIVEEAGHAVCGAFHNARDALSNVGELDPDLAIIDLNLADGDTGAAVAHTLQSLGIRVIHPIRKLERRRRSRVGPAHVYLQAC